jgi:hypothetical protein
VLPVTLIGRKRFVEKAIRFRGTARLSRSRRFVRECSVGAEQQFSPGANLKNGVETIATLLWATMNRSSSSALALMIS